MSCKDIDDFSLWKKKNNKNLYSIFSYQELTLSQTSPGFYMSAIQAF